MPERNVLSSRIYLHCTEKYGRLARVKTFIHQFSNGTVIRLVFDLSKDMPYCESNLAMDRQPVEILKEYRKWQNEVVVPELMNCLTPIQVLNFVQIGKIKAKK